MQSVMDFSHFPSPSRCRHQSLYQAFNRERQWDSASYMVCQGQPKALQMSSSGNISQSRMLEPWTHHHPPRIATSGYTHPSIVQPLLGGHPPVVKQPGTFCLYAHQSANRLHSLKLNWPLDSWLAIFLSTGLTYRLYTLQHVVSKNLPSTVHPIFASIYSKFCMKLWILLNSQTPATPVTAQHGPIQCWMFGWPTCSWLPTITSCTSRNSKQASTLARVLPPWMIKASGALHFRMAACICGLE